MTIESLPTFSKLFLLIWLSYVEMAPATPPRDLALERLPVLEAERAKGFPPALLPEALMFPP